MDALFVSNRKLIRGLWFSGVRQETAQEPLGPPPSVCSFPYVVQEEYEVELEAVEEVFLQEREGLLAANKVR